jgi:hypothetical protein
MPEIRNWKWNSREEHGKADRAADARLGSDSKVADPEIMRKAS